MIRRSGTASPRRSCEIKHGEAGRSSRARSARGCLRLPAGWGSKLWSRNTARAPIAPAGSIAGSRSNIGRIQRSPVCGISFRSARNVPIASRVNAFGYVISIDRAIICLMMIRKGDELYRPNGDMFLTKQLESDFESLAQTTSVLRLGHVPGCGSFLTRSLASELAGPRTCRFRYV